MFSHFCLISLSHFPNLNSFLTNRGRNPSASSSLGSVVTSVSSLSSAVTSCIIPDSGNSAPTADLFCRPDADITDSTGQVEGSETDGNVARGANDRSSAESVLRANWQFAQLQAAGRKMQRDRLLASQVCLTVIEVLKEIIEVS
ncbi:unnamed protein product [Protopolystoma xenopodis]|uniref:Uncharacterized protein n=1 Tax=Protopolystoma xenopodis TaxID=117903 RepID=A0A3S4ZXZ4_9PLAT|nr:unnamed protein product [Protopolystoma xenopodis]